MKVLVIGSGGREHALLWKLAHSPSVKEVYVIPGNDGMTDVAHLIPVKGTEDILDFARLMKVDLTVAGPETVLTEGLADKFAEKGMAFFGPSAAAAQIEGSKSFAKNLMKKYKIPTAAYETFTDEKKAVSYIKKKKKYPLVIKADGLASGNDDVCPVSCHFQKSVHGCGARAGDFVYDDFGRSFQPGCACAGRCDPCDCGFRCRPRRGLRR